MDKKYKKILNIISKKNCKILSRKIHNLYKSKNRIKYENKNILKKIGKELIDYIPKNNYKLFLDLCSAPGIYSKELLNYIPEIKGIGLSLDPKDGGEPYNKSMLNNRYIYLYKDITEFNIYKYYPMFDITMSSCIPYFKRNEKYDLLFKSLLFCLNFLKENGILIINFSYKNINKTIETIYLLKNLFKKVILYKSEIIWTFTTSFYIICYDYKYNYNYIKNINKKINIDYENKKIIYKLLDKFVFNKQINIYNKYKNYI